MLAFCWVVVRGSWLVSCVFYDNEKNSEKIFVAEKDETIVGVIAVWLHEQLDEYLYRPVKVAYISDLVAKSSFRGQGIESLLLAKAENYARSSGMKLIKIGSLARNTLSHAMYKKK